MKRSFTEGASRISYAGLGLAGTLLLISGCATTPPAPTASLASARSAIATAERADAGRYAAVELGDARQKLALADDAVDARGMVLAGRLADQSRVEAELATAKTALAKATEVNRELSRGADALTEEMQRAGDQR